MSIRWTGNLVAPETGRHTFAFTSDDGCRLYLDGKKLIDSWKIRAEETDYASVYLEKGKTYKLVAEYFVMMVKRSQSWLGEPQVRF